MRTLIALLALTLTADSQVPSPAGSYNLLICRGGCGNFDSTRAYIRGGLVLSDSILPQVRNAPFFLSNKPNGCFVLRILQERGDSYAGIIPVGPVYWKRAIGNDTIGFPIYRSPDAGYELSLVVSPRGLEGIGNSWGAGVVEIHAPDDSILAVRIGQPDSRLCKPDRQ